MIEININSMSDYIFIKQDKVIKRKSFTKDGAYWAKQMLRELGDDVVVFVKVGGQEVNLSKYEIQSLY